MKRITLLTFGVKEPVFLRLDYGDIIYMGRSVVFTDHKSLRYILNQKELNLRQRSRKGREKLLRVRALMMTVHNDLAKQIREAQGEAIKRKNLRRASETISCCQQPEIPVWKWERITMDFVSGLPRTPSGYDTIWVIVDRLTKSAHFLPMKKMDSMEKLTLLYLKEIYVGIGCTVSIISDRDIHFTSNNLEIASRALGKYLEMSNCITALKRMVKVKGQYKPWKICCVLKAAPTSLCTEESVDHLIAMEGPLHIEKRGKVKSMYIGHYKIVARVVMYLYVGVPEEKRNSIVLFMFQNLIMFSGRDV
ncbi:putative reverse transcriptase domain-containing protein [Tanacetum coccineum]